MKRYKKIIILIAVLVAACAALVIVKHTEEKKEQIKNTDEIILAVPADTVESLTWAYDETSLGFHKEDAWLWDDDAAFPVDGEKVRKLLSDFEEFGAAFVIENVEDFGQYGLDEPTCTIRFTAAGQNYEVKLGAFSTMDSERYVSIGNGNVYLVKHDPFDDFEIELKDMILHDKAPTFEKITKLSFGGAENYTAVRDEESTATYCENDCYYTQRNGKTVPLDTFRVEDYCANISLLSLKDYVSYNVTDEELAAWGLDTPELTATVDFTVTDADNNETADSFTLNIGRNREELAAKEAAEAKEEDYTGTVTAYARVGNSQIVYKIGNADYEKLAAAAYDDLRHNEVLTADFSAVSAMDVTLDGETYFFTSEMKKKGDGSDAETRVWSYAGEEISAAALSTAVKNLTATEFTEELPALKEEISVVFRLDNANYPSVPVALYRYNGESCLAVVNGETFALVNRSAAVDLMEAVYAVVLG